MKIKQLICLFFIFIGFSINADQFTSDNFIKTVSKQSDYSDIHFKKVTLIGENDFLPADDSDLDKYPFIDEDLKAIIRRTVRVNVGNKSFGSGFLMGNNGQCNSVLTARHNLNYKFLKKERHRKGKVLHLNQNLNISKKSIKSKILTKRGNIKNKWSIKNEGVLLDIDPINAIQCPSIPVIPRYNIKQFQQCYLIGYPSEAILNTDGSLKGSSGFSAVPNRKSNKKHNDKKRGIAKCEILLNARGIIIHNCDTLPGASGGPIVCKVKNKWSFLAVNNGGACIKNGKRLRSCYSNKKGPDLILEKRTKLDRVYNTAGSANSNGRFIHYDDIEKEYFSIKFLELNSKKRKSIQQTLKSHNLYHSTIDGLWGGGTQKALEDLARKTDNLDLLKSSDGSLKFLKKIISNEL